MDLVYASQFNDKDSMQIDAWGIDDLPSVNDLDVAAEAAAAALEVLMPSMAMPMPMLLQPAVIANTDSEDKLVSLRIIVDGDRIMASVDPVEMEDSDDMSESDDDESIHDLEEIREMIDRALNEDGDDEDGPVKGSSSAAHDLGLPEQPLSMEGISVSSDDVLEPAGMVLSVFDGMVVVQGLEGPKALDESSVLCLGDRTVIGRVEEVFGPVTCPLYALRWAGKQDAPSSLCSGANVFSVPRLCGFIPLDEIKSTRERASIDVLGADEGEEEVYFSDDEQEAEFMKVRSKRKADFTRQPPPKESGSRPNKGSGLNVPPAPGRGGGRGRGHAAAHQPSSSSHFRAMATASHMQSVALSDERGPKARQGSIMSSQYAPPQSSYQSASLYSALMPYMMPQPQPGASFPFQPTGYGAPPPHFPLFPPHPQYPPM